MERKATAQDLDIAMYDLHSDLTDYGGEGGEAADFLNSLADQRVTAEEAVAAAEYRQRLRATVAAFRETLHGEEQSIFSQRLWTERPLSVQEVADQHGLSREQIPQIEARVKTKLKAYLFQEFTDFPDLDIDFLEHLEQW
jgi:RNA polymerase sigma-32 factor